MQKQFAEINALHNTRLDIGGKIALLQQEKQAVEREMVGKLMDAGLHECFSINWSAVRRLTRK